MPFCCFCAQLSLWWYTRLAVEQDPCPDIHNLNQRHVIQRQMTVQCFNSTLGAPYKFLFLLQVFYPELSFVRFWVGVSCYSYLPTILALVWSWIFVSIIDHDTIKNTSQWNCKQMTSNVIASFRLRRGLKLWLPAQETSLLCFLTSSVTRMLFFVALCISYARIHMRAIFMKHVPLIDAVGVIWWLFVFFVGFGILFKIFNAAERGKLDGICTIAIHLLEHCYGSRKSTKRWELVINITSSHLLVLRFSG